MNTSPLFVSCAQGLEYLLVDELLALGCATATAARAGVNATGTLEHAMRAVMWSRLASRVLWPIAKFQCEDEQALYDEVSKIDWEQHIPLLASFAVNAHVSGNALKHEQYAALRVKDAIVDQLRGQTGVRPDIDTEHPDVRVDLVVQKGQATLSIDLGGQSLHRRGWRSAQGAAPLKENLAAAMLMRGKWMQVYANGGALLDPMCGAGTLVIEGALMAGDVAPGLQRHQGLPPTRWMGLPVALWKGLQEEATTRAEAGLSALRPVFFGSDLDPRAIDSAKENAARAGIAAACTFEQADVADLPKLTFETGLVVCNPPYDKRLESNASEYRALGDALQRIAPEWTGSILCGSDALAKALGLRWKKAYPLRNGALECSLLVIERMRQEVREVSAPAALSDGAQMVANRIRKNLKSSKAWRQREGINNWRAYDADIPEYAAAVDVYTESGTGHVWLHVQEYQAPSEIPEAVTRKRFADLLAGVREVFQVDRERVAVKTRRIAKGGSKYGQFDQRNDFIVVEEGAARLRVNLFDYLDTGVFLDHRPLRKRIHDEAEDTRFLNLFCYTGVASIQAALGRARSTTSVDLSGTYLQWLADNLAENQLAGRQHQIIQADVMQWLSQERAQYDLIFCDPPTFSNSKRAEDFEVQKSHVELIRLCVDRLAPGGTLYFSNNARRFKLDTDALATLVDIEDITHASIPPDFARNSKIHRAWRMTAK
ncbi:bifunctional 23S rRNA (guanine(2069)-N(7))-methyltransferase RlmK/23S rRNA (guanine(2445)-N(2))-methyltransferase RlmL [Lysobacter sp. HDW10]|uniref:bifunctional 23S rRNA (guanine(2069)-N(7))-methyltransferase RlmK/23S rRNA (guanine(2445)-N(2))-methyltransferase RlmL n=1 Tax=Lysobacter sp. HDW10 TaxID=2714936 RepID=UPI001F0F255C|nr:bifunctional 23S rRNA (guanine(2069)-N(7))-methyltransferase RlmK/23S rRNA (guanine(2445)-N(2))-methyltransferase RlmL [Lysobacter sp. HDW10]